jgi:hypothetical protein
MLAVAEGDFPIFLEPQDLLEALAVVGMAVLHLEHQALRGGLT